MGRYSWCVLLLLMWISVGSAQSLDGVRQAVDGDAAIWRQAVEAAVTRLQQTVPMTQRVVWALANIMQVETLRPVDATAAPPDDVKARILQLLAEAETYLAPGNVPPPPPLPPLPPLSTGNAALDALRRGPMPLAAKALVELGTSSPAVTNSVMIALAYKPYPEMTALAQQVLASHRGGDAEAVVISQIVGGSLRVPCPEAAGLLYLLRT
ncbi:MAG: hypothetical protein ABFE07_10950, partial [Armatimonadia bacterium]